MTQPPPPPQMPRPRPPQYQPPHSEGDATGGLIPYKNAPALIAYYLGIFSFICFIGAFIGLAAIILGIAGLRKNRENPAVKGVAHAWVGIILGLIFGGMNAIFLVMLLIAAVTG